MPSRRSSCLHICRSHTYCISTVVIHSLLCASICRSKKLAEESESHLKDILKVLENDRRFLVLASLADERTEILTAYIDELDRKGVPPPPTASDPQRRNK